MKKWISGIACLALMITMLSVMLVPATSVAAAPFSVENYLYPDSSYTAYINGSAVYYAFTPTSGGYYTIESNSSSDTTVTLYDYNGYSLDYNDDGGSNYNFLLTSYLYAYETYYYGVSFYGGGSGYLYFNFYQGSGSTSGGNSSSSTERLFADSLLPASASQFTCVDGGEGSVTVSSYGSGYRFVANQGWPHAYFADITGDNMIETNYYSGDYLNYDFEVRSGYASIFIYFCGQNPEDQAAEGTYVTLNELIDPSLKDGYGSVYDLNPGTYCGSVSVQDLGYREDLMGYDGTMYISGIKVFAINGEVVVNDVSIQRGSGTTTTTDYWYTTTTIADDYWGTTTRYQPSQSAERLFTNSLLPASASQFTRRAMGPNGNEEITVSSYGSGYRFTAPDGGWPCADFAVSNAEDMIETNYYSDDYLTYDFEVRSGYASIFVYFCGQNPQDQAMEGAYVTLNEIVDPSLKDDYYVMDISVGTYRGAVSVQELGYSRDLMGSNYEMYISGIKVFAVGGTVIVNDVSIQRGSGTTTTTDYWYTTTTTRGGEREPVPATTTAPRTTTTRGPAYTTTTRPLSQDSSVSVMPVVPGAIDVTPSTQPTTITTAPSYSSGITYSLLPNSTSEFYEVEGSWAGEGYIDIWGYDEGYCFYADQGWPAAYTFESVGNCDDSKYWVMTKKGSGSTLNYDFEVVSGNAKLIVYFCGQNPSDMASLGSFVSINALEMPDKKDPYTGDTVEDLPPGRYTASVDVDDLGYAESLLGENGEMLISGFKIFAVGGEVIIHDLSVTERSGMDNSHHQHMLYNMGYDEPVATNDVAATTTTYHYDANNPQNYIYYTVNADGVTATIVDGRFDTPGIRIPSVVGGKKVTAIADGAFSYQNRLYSIELPSTVTTIGDDAFYGCSNLTRVIFNQGAAQIGDYAFDGCGKLAKVYYSGSPYQWEYIQIGAGNGNLLSAQVYFDYAPYKAYPDVPKSAWYYEAVDHASNYGFITGYASGKFGAADNLQRQDFVVILARIAGADLTPYQNQNGGMRDVKVGAYYAPAVAWAVDNGIITGYQNGKFGVGDTITREQVCTIFYRYNGSPTVSNANGILGAYPDDKHVSAFSKEAMAWAVENEVISGTNGKLAPTAGASRAQIATIVMRMDNNSML